jgi:hypothetical protein
MNRKVLWIGDGVQPPLTRRRPSPDAAEFVVLRACDELEAVELIKWQRVDVVCIDASSIGAGVSAVGATIKSVQPQVPIVLILGSGALPTRFKECVDVIIDETTLDVAAEWLIEELSAVRFPNVLRCFDEPTHRSSTYVKDEALGDS